RSQIEVDHRTLVDAHEVMRNLVADFDAELRGRELEFSLELNARESWVAADAGRLRQVLANLLDNALHATPPGGRVTLSSANMGADLRLIVRDTGAGIEASNLERIFRPFMHSGHRAPGPRGIRIGIGLGLAIVKGLVEAHGGRIAAFSEGVGKGARLVVDLPCVPKAMRDAARDQPVEGGGNGSAATPPVTSKRILLVEDDSDTAAVLKQFLELEGYDVTLAHDVATAAELASDSIDVLVCDIGLPDGSGFDLMRKISAQKPIKAIALTGYGSPRDVDAAASAGFAMHLTKPVTVEALVAAIESVGESTGETKASAASTPAAR
ncbi:MAG: hybrid sensor histidine kinase/response regulator, partial [Candidatus Binatia bacterium]